MIKYLSKLFTTISLVINFMILKLRRIFVRFQLAKVGRNFRFGRGSEFELLNMISIGDDVFMSERTYISTTVPLIIGDNVMFGPEVMLIGGDHNISAIGCLMKDAKVGGQNESIVLENDVWVGARTTILKGVRIREGAVVGACSVVSRSILPYSVNVGNPCRFIRCRFSKADLELHLKGIPTQYAFDQVLSMYAEAGHQIAD